MIFSTEFLDETRNYRIDDVQNKMWTTMAQEMNASGKGRSKSRHVAMVSAKIRTYSKCAHVSRAAAECKKKWQNLCAIFGKHLKRRRTTKLELKKVKYLRNR